MGVFNGENFVGDALKSVLSQSHRFLEVIVVDDGSTDGTRNVLRRYRDQRIRVIYQKNRGLTAALNHGLTYVTGEFVARQDADDVSAPDRIEKQLQYLAANPEVCAVGSWVGVLDEDGTRIGGRHYQSDSELLHEQHIEANQFAHGSLMFRNDVLWEVGGYREQFKCAQDYDLTLRLQDRCRTANLEEELYFMRHRRTQISIARSREQQAFSELARMLARERRATGTDSLFRGVRLEDLLSSEHAQPTDFDDIRLSFCMRSGLGQKARESIVRLLRRQPGRTKLYVQWLVTWGGGRVMRALAKTWDRRANATRMPAKD
jgi:glycosyltransferase involved in cell wall biosynthesis